MPSSPSFLCLRIRRKQCVVIFFSSFVAAKKATVAIVVAFFFVFEKKTTMHCRFLLWFCYNEEGDGRLLPSLFSLCLRIRRRQQCIIVVANSLWAKCEDETHTPKSGNLESSGTPKNSKLDCKGQNTSHWDVLYTNGKVLKCRCRKWPCMNHLDICSPSYGQKKGQESNWQFDSRPLKVRNRPLPDVCRRSAIGH